MKIINIILAIMFSVFAGLQFNDPDPVVWILIYGTMTAVCLMAVFRLYSKLLMLFLSVVYISYAVVLWPGVITWFNSPDRSLLFDDLSKMMYPYIEETREFIGLLICLLVLSWQWIKASARLTHKEK